MIKQILEKNYYNFLNLIGNVFLKCAKWNLTQYIWVSIRLIHISYKYTVLWNNTSYINRNIKTKNVYNINLKVVFIHFILTFFVKFNKT